MIMSAVWRPAWLEALDTEKFFVGCSLHDGAKKNEKNILCLDCCTSICPHCLPLHRFHWLVQVRRYVYNDVVRLEDIEKFIDCSGVQSYIINSSKVVFIKKRLQSRQFKGSGNMCTSCDRSLQEPYIHCSLGCKVDYLVRQKKDLSLYLRRWNTLQLSSDMLICHDIDNEANETAQPTIVKAEEPAGSLDSEVMCKTILEHARSLSGFSNEDMGTNMNRRKGNPHRSPLC